jgi:hypothetical protein
MTSTYSLIDRRIVEVEQGGSARAGYGEELIRRLAKDLTRGFGRGFSKSNLEQLRRFSLAWPIAQTVPGRSEPPAFRLPWSHYVNLLGVADPTARVFYGRRRFVAAGTAGARNAQSLHTVYLAR